MCSCSRLSRTAKTLYKTAQPLFIFITFFLICCVASIFYLFVFYEIADSSGTIIFTFHVLLSHWLLFNCFLNQYLCSFTSPGYTIDEDKIDLAEKFEGNCRYCFKCDRPKPPRCHHCSICNRCVLSMDHHCPWMGTCIGKRNYKFFILFLFYMELGSIYSTATVYSYTPNLVQIQGGTLTTSSLPIFCSFSLTGAITAALFILGSWHLYLIRHSSSTLDIFDDWEEEKWKHPKPTFAAKWRELFEVEGRFWWLTWCLPSFYPTPFKLDKHFDGHRMG
mmetsp:Transcript_8060/g.15630  ORF Transcript_8060/g.15630 Transcript_8060/m.15630 type:complete len:277 (-) Transcript_8060:227-1057(-)